MDGRRCNYQRLFFLLVLISICAFVFLDKLVSLDDMRQFVNDLEIFNNKKSSNQSYALPHKLRYLEKNREKIDEFMAFLNQPNHEQENNLLKWNFTLKVNCPKMNISNVNHPRKQVMLKCSGNHGNLRMTEVIGDVTVPHFSFNDSCLVKTINSNCYNDHLLVPSVVHYVLFHKQPLEFYNLLSIYSAYKKAKPCLIIIHSDFPMFGKYWDYLLQIVPVIIQVIRDPPTHIFSHKIKKVEHQSDWARLQALQAFGGIYLDTDQVLVRDILPFRKKTFTLSHENPKSLSNAVIFSNSHPKFIEVWQEAYSTFNPNGWGEHSVLLPLKLAQIFPHLISVEKVTTFLKPIPEPGDAIFFKNFNWSKSYGLHLYIRNYKRYNSTIDNLYNPEKIRKLNSTVGAVARYILFNRKELCEK